MNNWYAQSPEDTAIWDLLARSRRKIEALGGSLALTIPDWYIGVTQRADGPIYLLISPDKVIVARGSGKTFQDSFGSQIWIAFERITKIRPTVPSSLMPQIDGIDLAKDHLTPPVYGVLLRDIVQWID